MLDLRARLQAALGAAYRLEQELSGGGMSRVFVGTDARLDRPVVIKVLPPDLGAGVNIARFQREIAVVAKLQHPHIVPLLTTGSHDDLLYYIMPYIDGQSLRERLAATRAVSPGETLRILREVADALAYAHARGIVHRDIKPGNILLSAKHAFVTDFGVAKALEESTGQATLLTAGVALGTPAYMAPEQATGDPNTDHRADIYALGVLGYEMLTRRTPFTGTSPQALLAARLTQEPEPLSKQRDVPPALADVVMRCLAKDPADRWQSATEVHEQLEGMLTPSTGGVTPAATRALTLPRGRRAAVLVVAIGIALAAAGFVTFRALGGRSGPTLFASGVLEQRDRLVLADFDNRTRDSTLGLSLSEALRIDLAQSPAVRLLDAAAVGAALQRMQRPPGTRLDLALARDLAQREGAKAVVRGQIDPVGSGYVLAVELIAPADGSVLVALRESARDDGALIDAVDRLSKQLRQRIGESLRTVRASEPLERVTTSSLEALQLYSQALAQESYGAWDREIELLEQAVALDSGFAMAHRKLATVLYVTFAPPSRAAAAGAAAYRHRDRLPPLERQLTTAYHYTRVEPDRGRAEAAYRAALEIDPDNFIAASNLAQLYNDMRRFAAAESVALRHVGGANMSIYYTVAVAQLGQGKIDEAAAVVRLFQSNAPNNPGTTMLLAFWDYSRDAFDSAEARVRALPPAGLDLVMTGWRTSYLSALAQLRGRLRATAAENRPLLESLEQRRLFGQVLGAQIELAMTQLRFERRPVVARRTVDAALVLHPLSSIPVEDRPYAALILFFSELGDVAQARRMLAEYHSSVPEQTRRADPFRHSGEGALALAEGRRSDAMRSFRAWYDEAGCARCGLYELANAYDQAGDADSAIAVGERALRGVGFFRVYEDAWGLGPLYKRLGELYEQRGDRARAQLYYGKFVDLWKDADPVLQPTVHEVRERLAKLVPDSP